jgi:hypothetical protein
MEFYKRNKKNGLEPFLWEKIQYNSFLEKRRWCSLELQPEKRCRPNPHKSGRKRRKLK